MPLGTLVGAPADMCDRPTARIAEAIDIVLDKDRISALTLDIDDVTLLHRQRDR
jgi:hypothetical protein